MNFWVVVGIIIAGIWLLANKTLEHLADIKKRNLERKKIQFEQKELFIKYKQEVKESLDTLLKEKSQGFPCLANAIADYYENFDKIFAIYLETKPRPAFVQAEKIKEIAKEKKLFKKEFLTTKYIIEYYENLFPWLREYVGFSSDELIEAIYSENISEEDPVSFYITQSEFKNLSVTERNQRVCIR
jgi:hypothetical protein